jgi:hypothetical protein
LVTALLIGAIVFAGGFLGGPPPSGSPPAASPSTPVTAASPSATPPATPSPTPTSTSVEPTPTPAGQCVGDVRLLVDEFYPDPVVGGNATPPDFDTNDFGEGRQYCLTNLATYHWNEGQGAPEGGTLTLLDESGTMLGSWPATATEATGGVLANWVANIPTVPTPVILEGTYTVMDSDPATLSRSEASAGAAFLRVWVTDYIPPGGTPEPPPVTERIAADPVARDLGLAEPAVLGSLPLIEDPRGDFWVESGFEEQAGFMPGFRDYEVGVVIRNGEREFLDALVAKFSQLCGESSQDRLTVCGEDDSYAGPVTIVYAWFFDPLPAENPTVNDFLPADLDGDPANDLAPPEGFPNWAIANGDAYFGFGVADGRSVIRRFDPATREGSPTNAIYTSGQQSLAWIIFGPVERVLPVSFVFRPGSNPTLAANIGLDALGHPDPATGIVLLEPTELDLRPCGGLCAPSRP